MAKKSKNTAIRRGRALTQLQKEMIVQSFALCGNKSQVAREMGCSQGTVQRVVKEATLNRDLQAARTAALEDVAGQLHGKTVEVINSITPEDMESGLIKKFAKDDPKKLVSVRAYGPSLLQKVTSAAILTDKLKVVEETKRAILADSGDGHQGLPLPGTIQESLRLVGAKIKRLRILDVQFDNKHEDTANKVQEVAHAASLNDNVEDADIEDIDWDNPE